MNALADKQTRSAMHTCSDIDNYAFHTMEQPSHSSGTPVDTKFTATYVRMVDE